MTKLPREREKTVPACTVDLLAPPLDYPVPEVIDTQPLLDCVSLDLLVSVSIDAGTPVDLGDHFAAGEEKEAMMMARTFSLRIEELWSMC